MKRNRMYRPVYYKGRIGLAYVDESKVEDDVRAIEGYVMFFDLEGGSRGVKPTELFAGNWIDYANARLRYMANDNPLMLLRLLRSTVVEENTPFCERRHVIKESEWKEILSGVSDQYAYDYENWHSELQPLASRDVNSY